MNISTGLKILTIALASITLSGCLQAIYATREAAETPDSEGIVPAKYRGESCAMLAAQRELAVDEATRPSNYTEYMRKHARWKLAAIEQVEREKSCLLGITADEANALELMASKKFGPPEYFVDRLKSPAAKKAGADYIASLKEPKSKTASSNAAKPQGVKSKSTAPTPPPDKATKSTISKEPSFARPTTIGPSSSERGWLGIQVYENMPEGVASILNAPPGKGLFVRTVASGSAAEKSGMRSADVILSIDGHEFTKGSEFTAYMSTLPVGHLLKLKIIRAQIPMDQIIQLTEKLPSM